MVMLEYTDNSDWVESDVLEAFSRHTADAEVLIQPLSLTAGVHTGPGTWGVAFLTLPEETAPSETCPMDCSRKTSVKIRDGGI